MFRLLTILVLGMIVYFTLKSKFTALDEKPKSKEVPPPEKKGNEDDASEMKKDPVCGTWVEDSSSYYADTSSGRVYFCSAECRDKYSSS